MGRGEWGGDSEERGLQELLERTHGPNQGGGWRWGREVGSAGVGWREWRDNRLKRTGNKKNNW